MGQEQTPGSVGLDVTLDASLAETPTGVVPRIYLIEGAAAGISDETETLLRARLRVAALVMSAGFAVFLAWDLLLPGTSGTLDSWLFGAHILVTLALAGCGAMLYRKCDLATRVLHLDELAIFGLPALFFLFFQYVYMVEYAEHHRALPNVSGMWLTLIFTYALFIPNSWPRAATVVGLIAAAPLLLSLSLLTFHGECRSCTNANASYFSESALLMLVGAVTATVGVHTIGNLRRAAFEAKQLGQYRLGRRLGGGGMGEVYLAEHQLMSRPCAIKIIRPDKTDDARVLARFEREVRATAQLSHWNNIDIFDYGRADDGTFYYVMEYLPGLSLGDLVDRYGALAAPRVVHFLLQTCDALSEAHAEGLIHRDIKPANLFAAQRGGLYDVAKLLDFGLVKPVAEGDTESVQLTQDGTITGSPLFMSPEQSIGERDPDGRGDIYSLGAVAYYMLTGRPPFDYSRPMKVLLAHAHEVPTSPSEVNPNVPDDLSDVVLRCLAKEPEDRYQEAAALAAALQQCDCAGQWTREDAANWWREHEAKEGIEAQRQ